ncbi:ABC transporter ATP-binding protein [Glutamicibacter sp.]|uniref:ABC transporter ATP-binding protein n=1 Tax=Glutamicibacter sp. TaxID=1931995 RepID=UPI0028BF4C2E|nr:ABC transporter ATP-binding protein [Glutamicibacter sp.]
MSEMLPCIEVQQLNVKRGKSLVIHDIDFNLMPGRIIGLLGPSGSGKSTLLRSIVGNQITSSGSVSVLGMPAGDKSLRRHVGYMTQAASVYDDLTVLQNISYFAKIMGQPKSEITRVVEATDLGAQSNQLVMDLSGGQRNRVSLAIALLGSPKIVILDEPTVGLDPVLRSELWHLFAQLAQTGMCLVISSHVMDEAMRCDEILLLREGKLLAQITPQHLLEQTGSSDPEEAFLRLIAVDSQGPGIQDQGSSHGRHRAGAKGEQQ